jgi:hypothetical protein
MDSLLFTVVGRNKVYQESIEGVRKRWNNIVRYFFGDWQRRALKSFGVQ